MDKAGDRDSLLNDNVNNIAKDHENEFMLLKANRSLEQLSEEERWRYEHELFHAEHHGHETMHAEMFFVFVITMVIAQIALVEWKKRWLRSYQFATLIGMWFIPAIFCIYSHWWRFILIWLVFSSVTMFVVRKAIRKPIDGQTPSYTRRKVFITMTSFSFVSCGCFVVNITRWRIIGTTLAMRWRLASHYSATPWVYAMRRMVYTWFILIYKASYGLGLVGYFALMLTLLGVNLAFQMKPHTWIDFGIMCIFYGLYYGVMGRDFAEICSDRMAASIGYYSPNGMPIRRLDPGVCAVCGNGIDRPTDDNSTVEKTYQLACSHIFHEFCIRGWCIVGKKQTCPYCKEKVDLKRMFCNPWEKPHMLYGQLLDWIRYLVAWQPLIMTFVQLIIWFVGLK